MMQKSLSFFCRLLLIALASSVLTFPAAATCDADDEAGLLAFKSGIISDPLGLLADWTPGTDCCTWHGIECSSDGRVTGVYLNHNSDEPPSLSGTISPSLSRVSKLGTISLWGFSNLTGPLPESLFFHPTLDAISIIDSGLTGPLPTNHSPGSVIRLISLNNNRNLGRISGTIPPSFATFRRLTSLWLSGNQLTGPIPEGLLRMPNLTDLELDHNQLSGPIPDFSPTQLQYLRLSYNQLTGRIPPSLTAVAPTISQLWLDNNRLSGRIPDVFSNFTQLGILMLSNNSLSGHAPGSFANLTNLFALEMANNRLAGQFPNLTNRVFYTLDLSYNRFHLETIPKWLSSLDFVYSLKLARCGIRMRIEDWQPRDTQFGSSYGVVDLSDNRITGSLVELLRGRQNMVELRAAGNALKFNMTELTFSQALATLDVSRNSIFGTVPPAITSLKELNVSCNHLCGSLPPNDFPAAAFVGNDCLCGAPLSPCPS